MDKEFVPYQESLELKELGFDEPCFGYYDIDSQELVNDKWMQHPNESTWTINAPTFSQVFRWFREKYNLWQIVQQNTDSDWTYDIMPIKGVHNINIIDVFDTYEEAELACLRKLIEIVKNG